MAIRRTNMDGSLPEERVYQLFGGNHIESFLSMEKEDRTPMTIAEIMQRQLNVKRMLKDNGRTGRLHAYDAAMDKECWLETPLTGADLFLLNRNGTGKIVLYDEQVAETLSAYFNSDSATLNRDVNGGIPLDADVSNALTGNLELTSKQLRDVNNFSIETFLVQEVRSILARDGQLNSRHARMIMGKKKMELHPGLLGVCLETVRYKGVDVARPIVMDPLDGRIYATCSSNGYALGPKNARYPLPVGPMVGKKTSF
jgi:hypothetical protein